MPETRVAMIGTFDVANFGDLLFPALAAHELGRRLDTVEIDLYSYRALAGSDWPYRVRSLGELPRTIQQYDLLLIGGGHIVRSDPDIADGYLPADPAVHHPLGLWLVPALLAAAARVPFAFNAVGVSANLAPWAHPLIEAALTSAAHIAVRDDPSAQTLADIAPNAVVEVAPDTAFGIGALIANGGAAARPVTGLNGQRYVVVQPCRAMSSDRDHIVAAVEAARQADMAVLELPIGPALGDRVGVLELPGDTFSTDDWPAPIDVAQLIGNAEAVVAESLHAGIVAVTQGVPVLRPVRDERMKYGLLSSFTGVHTLGSADPGETFGRGAPDPELSVITARVAAHWDAVADLAGRGPAPVTEPAVLRLLAELPARFEGWAQREHAHAAVLDRAAEYEAGYLAFAARTAELGAELAPLRDRALTLARIEAGGWWRLRGRLLPLLRIASAVRRPRR